MLNYFSNFKVNVFLNEELYKNLTDKNGKVYFRWDFYEIQHWLILSHKYKNNFIIH